ncbi:ATP-grasp domain-containing protein [Zooshikella sp. RANM57]|uniref:ATP-grasp domain-containing protein n=1 Tax=Zooshikella sp. RANM57 TaxID=3425863 RepID=UPI003D6FCCF5
MDDQTAILVTGASGIVGYGILKTLKDAPFPLRLFGSSIYTMSVACQFCDTFLKAPRTEDSGYLDWLLAMITKLDIRVVVPGIEVDMFFLNKHRQQLSKINCFALLNQEKLIDLCRDKWTFFDFLSGYKLSCLIPTETWNGSINSLTQVSYPLLFKPRQGYASKGHRLVKSKAELTALPSSFVDTYIVQPYIGNKEQEYSIAVFGDGKGGFFNKLCLRRTLSPMGYTDFGQYVELDNIDSTLKELCAILKPLGPTNFQFRLHDGEFKLLEVNPRISSSTSIRALLGYNEAVMALSYFLKGQAPSLPVIKPGYVVRYIEDCVFYEDGHHF